MFRQVTLSNFKSIRDEVTIEFGDLTVMTGSNSSGKSTVLQSLLLLSQTLRYAGTDRQLVLNGPLARLGEFSDILNARSTSGTVGIGVQVAPPPGPDEDRETPQSIIRRTQRPALVAADWQFSGRAARGDVGTQEGKTFPSVESFGLCAFYRMGDQLSPTSMRVSRHSWRPARRYAREGYGGDASESLANSLAWYAELDGMHDSDTLPGDVRGVVFDHAFPAKLSTRVDVMQVVAGFTLNALSKPARRQGVIDDYQLEAANLWQLVRRYGIEPTGIPIPDELRSPTLGAVKAWIDQLTRIERRRVLSELESAGEKILSKYRTSHKPEYWLTADDLPASVERAIASTRSELSAIRYLGPLRIQPAALYPVATTLGSEDVGPSGEWTASVLDAYKDKRVSYLSPSSIPFSDSAERRESTLSEAVDEWMNYLGVSGDVHTVDRGSMGHELTVSTDTAGQDLPLTHVGVGVSQCLPVVVSMLLARENTITLLEQPELHLHPAVQSRLADFLLAMALSGRQCLVETHSEYLINRLRLRTAEDKTDTINDRLRIYFARIDGGRSAFSELELNEYGAIANWPRGFFDEAQDDVEALLRASAAKRADRRTRASRT